MTKEDAKIMYDMYLDQLIDGLIAHGVEQQEAIKFMQRHVGHVLASIIKNTLSEYDAHVVQNRMEEYLINNIHKAKPYLHLIQEELYILFSAETLYRMLITKGPVKLNIIDASHINDN